MNKNLYLKNFTLIKNSEPGKNEILIYSFCYDEKNIEIFPPQGLSEQFCFDLEEGENARAKGYIGGEGIPIWTKNIVDGTLKIILLFYESDKKIRSIGENLDKFKDNFNVDISKIINSPITSITNDAVSTITNIIGKVFSLNNDDRLHTYTASYENGTFYEGSSCNGEHIGIEMSKIDLRIPLENPK